MPEISIIVPVYNVQPYLRECMESLIGQTFRGIEFICIDDGSTDDSPSILAEYAARDRRVKVLTQANRGLSAARNAGLAVATAPYIMFCDSDDWYSPTMCEKMYAAMQGNADMAVCGVQEVADEECHITSGEYFELPAEGEIDVDDDILMRCNVCAWNKIYRRDILERGQLRFPDGLYFEDEYFFAVYTAYVRRVAFVPDKLYYYRRRTNSIMGRVVGGSAEYTGDYTRIADRIWLYHEEHNLAEQRILFLTDTWLKLCAIALDACITPEECADTEAAIIAFAEAHVIPRGGLPTVTMQRLRMLMGHRWVGLHRHLNGFISSRCREQVVPNGYMIKRKYYCMRVPIWMQRVWLPASGEDRSSSHFWGALIKTKDTAAEREVRILGAKVYKGSYREDCVVRRLFGFRMRRKLHSQRVDLELSPANFHPYASDDGILLAKLREPGAFTYIPNPGNLGDIFIAASTFRFFEKHSLPYTRFTGWNAVSDTIVYGGGGIWTPDYISTWGKFLPYFKRAKRVLILPSSFHNCPQFVQQLDSRFTVFCRDRRSYEYLRQANSGADILLDHDMAFRMDDSVFRFQDENFGDYVRRVIVRVSAARKSGSTVGRFLRRDGESIHSHLASDMDISDYAYGSENMSAEFAKQCAAVMLSVVDSTDAVITDRLHVGIAAVLMGKDVYLMDNNYGKLSSVFEFSLSGNPQVHFVERMPSHLTFKYTVSDNLSRLFCSVQK